MILRDRCSTSYDLASIFRGRLSSKMKEVSQNCFVFDVVNLKKGGFAELLSV